MSSSAELPAQPIDSPHKTIVILRQGHRTLFRCVVDGQEAKSPPRLPFEIEQVLVTNADVRYRSRSGKAPIDLTLTGCTILIEGFTQDKQYYLAVIHTPRTGVYAQRFLASEGLPLGLPLFCEIIPWGQLSALCAEGSPDAAPAFNISCSNPVFGVLA